MGTVKYLFYLWKLHILSFDMGYGHCATLGATLNPLKHNNPPFCILRPLSSFLKTKICSPYVRKNIRAALFQQNGLFLQGRNRPLCPTYIGSEEKQRGKKNSGHDLRLNHFFELISKTGLV